MNYDPNIIVTAVALAAIISPIVVALINNAHQTKLRKMDIAQEHEVRTLNYIRSVYEKYLSDTSNAIIYRDEEHLAKYRDSYTIALMYLPAKSSELTKSIDSAILNGDWEVASDKLIELSQWLSDLTKRLL